MTTIWDKDNEDRYIMLKFITDNVTLTKDAVLVQRHLREDLGSPLHQLAWKDKIDELVKEAKRMEKEEKEK